jgi:hypothetical protein
LYVVLRLYLHLQHQKYRQNKDVVMRIATFRKQPSERKRYVIDMSPWMTGTNEYVADVDASVAVRALVPVPTELPMAVEDLEIPDSSQEFSFFVAGGEDGITYTLTLVVTTTINQIKEIELDFRVKDD